MEKRTETTLMPGACSNRHPPITEPAGAADSSAAGTCFHQAFELPPTKPVFPPFPEHTYRRGRWVQFRQYDRRQQNPRHSPEEIERANTLRLNSAEQTRGANLIDHERTDLQSTAPELFKRHP